MVTSESSSGVQALNLHCRESEQKALLMLKDGFHTSLARFSSWIPEEDCCKWRGVGCNNETGHVISLDLHSPDSSELLQGPAALTGFRVSSMKVLDLSSVYLGDVVNWLDAVNMLPSLVELRLVSCQLHNLPQSLPSLNFSSLEVLDLSHNGFYHSLIPNWLVEVSHTLHLLNLTTCSLQGSIPHAIVNFTSLVVLDFSFNYLKGSIPHGFGSMTSLAVLDLSFNYLEGPLPATLGLIQESHHFKHSPLRELRLPTIFC
ncbi:hypothetical protein GH714_018619 [Hevea brasiliensis]|uniref:Leucine-rich repeat-containing N-terminal plant-type domain-containing protein n=1 Tax=Hevea brasiliensis TaxID=3981 RepID=A0A6A6N393_HEVBR|nr:hypothetical protein GH714_018619 [Hevea brasiliensis]